MDGSTCNEGGSSCVQVSVLSKPFQGMIFQSMEAAQTYYKQYGKENGFPTRIKCQQKRKCRSNDVNYCCFVCGREGTHRKKYSTAPVNPDKPIIRRSTSTIKKNCKAHMRIIRKDSGEWIVSVFNDEHNHTFVSPTKRMCMRENKHMPLIAKSLSVAFQDSNLPVGKVVNVLDGDALGFTERDCYNHLNASKTYKLPREWDATLAFSYFKKKKLTDPQFFYHVQVDSQSRAINFFWVDGRSREQYKHFGDVVTFDTTYRKNVYELPFGPFTGVNHNKQSIQFGCGLLLDETEESFEWLFGTWLEAMGGVPMFP